MCEASCSSGVHPLHGKSNRSHQLCTTSRSVPTAKTSSPSVKLGCALKLCARHPRFTHPDQSPNGRAWYRHPTASSSLIINTTSPPAGVRVTLRLLAAPPSWPHGCHRPEGSSCQV